MMSGIVQRAALFAEAAHAAVGQKRKYTGEPYIVGISKDQVSPEDVKRLDELGFFWAEKHDCFQSFRFGSA